MRVPTTDEKALGHQAVERVEPGVGDRFRSFHRRAAGEHREPREALLLGVAEQLVAPVYGRTQRLLACGRVPGAGAQHTERFVQAFGDLLGGQQPAPRRRQLDGQWQPIDASADLRDGGRVGVVEVKVGVVGARSRAEQHDGVHAGQRVRVHRRRSRGQP